MCRVSRVVFGVSRILRPVLYSERVPSWCFVTNQVHVLLCIARDPGIRVRDLAQRVGVTERAAQRIVADLIAAEYLERTRDGRRNRYQVRAELPLRHPVEQHHRVGDLLSVLADVQAGQEPSAEEAS